MNATLMHFDKRLILLEEWDPNRERISQIRREIEKVTACCKELYKKEEQMMGFNLLVTSWLFFNISLF
ncbi:hypothetical protein HZS_5959 [Henneguya salminicola]|nr:hypothetical protein HZS_5959 [Henneguya salminicola]